MTRSDWDPDHDAPMEGRCGVRKSPRATAKPSSHPSAFCTQLAGWGTNHLGVGPCKLHLGTTASKVKAAQPVMMERMVQRFALPVDVEPGEAITQAIARANGAVLYCADQVKALDPDEIVWGKQKLDKKVGREQGTQVAYVNESAGAGVNYWVQLYYQWDKRLTDLCIDALKLGLRELEIDIAKQHGEQLLHYLRSVVSDPELGLDEEAQRRVVDRHLSLVS
jgi:hypothetical protein